jgi:hypothetical protein
VKFAKPAVIAAIAAVAVATVLSADLARAGGKWVDNNNPLTIKNRLETKANGVFTCGSPQAWVDLAQSVPNLIFCTEGGWPNYCVIKCYWDGPRAAAVCHTAVYCLGNTSGGGLQTSALPDSVVASVGGYITGGGTNLQNPPADSMMAFVIERHVPAANQIRLTMLNKGQLAINPMHTRSTTKSAYTVFIYPNQAAFDADLREDGTGATTAGSVTLAGGENYPGGPAMSTTGIFAPGDWVFQPPLSGSKFSVRPNGAIVKTVTLADGAAVDAAIVTGKGDALSIDRVVPGFTPMGLALLALALMGGGLWVMRSRRSVATA